VYHDYSVPDALQRADFTYSLPVVVLVRLSSIHEGSSVLKFLCFCSFCFICRRYIIAVLSFMNIQSIQVLSNVVIFGDRYNNHTQ
jgi:hypothetical protein